MKKIKIYSKKEQRLGYNLVFEEQPPQPIGCATVKCNYSIQKFSYIVNIFRRINYQKDNIFLM